MSGALKSGLVFGFIELLAVLAFSIIFSIIPAGGPVLCGPLAAAVTGCAAGYFGVRWSADRAGIGQGVLAGTIAGLGGLISALILFIVGISVVRALPGFDQQLQEMLQQQQPDVQIDPAELDRMLGIVGPILGFCFGLINLLVSLALGALGGWIAVRNRSQPTQNTPFEPPPMAPPS